MIKTIRCEDKHMDRDKYLTFTLWELALLITALKAYVKANRGQKLSTETLFNKLWKHSYE